MAREPMTFGSVGLWFRAKGLGLRLGDSAWLKANGTPPSPDHAHSVILYQTAIMHPLQ